MRIVRPSEVKPEVEKGPLFVGEVTRQTVVTGDMGKSFNSAIINFAPGARNRFHAHSGDQILIATAGRGIIATDKERFNVDAGDIIFIPAGEKHWHGAAADSFFSHISVQTRDSKTNQLET